MRDLSLLSLEKWLCEGMHSSPPVPGKRLLMGQAMDNTV